MKRILIYLLLILPLASNAQSLFDLTKFKPADGVKAMKRGEVLIIQWPTGNDQLGRFAFDLRSQKPLFKSITLTEAGKPKEIAAGLDPAFILTVGKRDLISQNGWNIFFDKVHEKPYQTFKVNYTKYGAAVVSEGSRTIVRMPGLSAGTFRGDIEVTFYNGSALVNVAAVMSTDQDSTAIIYDAGLVTDNPQWQQMVWSDTNDQLQSVVPSENDTSRNLAVKYRTIMAEGKEGSMAVFPAPHQYFYPLDEAFNLNFTSYGRNYRKLLPGFWMGIRQDLAGDRRFVPWFNAPPKTLQRLNFFVLLSTGKPAELLNGLKKYTHEDSYKPLPGFKTMASHFHNEYIMNVVLAGKPVEEKPEFVDVFKRAGVDIVHLGEFHYTAHPKGPDSLRLRELKALFDMCSRLSDEKFLLLPGEEPNVFLGGHWMAFFPKPVYWVMSRKANEPFVKDDPVYGKIYHVGSKDEILQLLELEKGLAWTAHARTKGSTNFPDKHKEEAFYKSDRFMGAAWKYIPADLSEPRLGRRVLDLMDDMNNWGLKKHVIGEADLFTITEENEMYAHLNVNYLEMDKLPAYTNGWQPVLDKMQEGKFFTSTGEVLLPKFRVNGKGAGETASVSSDGMATVELDIDWTFPLNFVEIISGNGKDVFREKIDLRHTTSFGKEAFSFKTNLRNRTWVRVEVWDSAVNGAFTQTVWLNSGKQ